MSFSGSLKLRKNRVLQTLFLKTFSRFDGEIKNNLECVPQQSPIQGKIHKTLPICRKKCRIIQNYRQTIELRMCPPSASEITTLSMFGERLGDGMGELRMCPPWLEQLISIDHHVDFKPICTYSRQQQKVLKN